MKLIRFEAENFKRIQAIAINCDGSVVQITGRNGQGKSSCLDAIVSAFGGAKHAPERPIRKGAEYAKVVAETDEIKVTRKWTAKGDSLIVESKEGARFPSPQAMLDKLHSNLSFDPLAFSRMPEKKQAELLRQVIGVDTTAIEKQRADLFGQRTLVNAEVKRLQAVVDSTVIPAEPEPAGEEIDVLGIAQEKAAAVERRNFNDKLRLAAVNAKKNHDDALALVAALEAKLEKARQAVHAALKERDAAVLAAEGLNDPDIASFDKRISEAKSHNTAVRERLKRWDDYERHKKDIASVVGRVHSERDRADQLTERLKTIDDEKAKLLADAKFPIPGMAVEADQVTIDGVPFSQASTAEQIRVGLAIGAALNPKLRVVLIRDGSLLDADSMSLVEQWANENNMLVIMERVAMPGAVGVVIEDGMVAATPEPEMAETK